AGRDLAPRRHDVLLHQPDGAVLGIDRGLRRGGGLRARVHPGRGAGGGHRAGGRGLSAGSPSRGNALRPGDPAPRTIHARTPNRPAAAGPPAWGSRESSLGARRTWGGHGTRSVRPASSPLRSGERLSDRRDTSVTLPCPEPHLLPRCWPTSGSAATPCP